MRNLRKRPSKPDPGNTGEIKQEITTNPCLGGGLIYLNVQQMNKEFRTDEVLSEQRRNSLI